MRFARMSASGPALKLVVQLVIQTAKDVLGDHVPIVVRPAVNHRVQAVDESELRVGLVGMDYCCQVSQMSFLSLFAWLDEGLEAKKFPRRTPCRMSLPDRVLAHLKAEEVKSRTSLLRAERMGDACLLGFQFQPHPVEPLRHDLLDLFDDRQIVVQHHEVVGIADDLRSPVLSFEALGEGSDNLGFEAMEGDVGEQRRDHPALRCSLVGGEKLTAFHDSGFEPRSDGSSEGRKGTELLEKRRVVDPIKAFSDIRIEDVPWFAADGPENGSDGVVGGASRSKPVTVRLEMCFPFRFQREFSERLLGADSEGGNPQSTFLRRAWFRNPDATKGLRRIAESDVVGQLQTFSGGEIAHSVDARRPFSAIILGYLADRQQSG